MKEHQYSGMKYFNIIIVQTIGTRKIHVWICKNIYEMWRLFDISKKNNNAKVHFM